MMQCWYNMLTRLLTVDHGIQGGDRELPTFEHGRSPMFPETTESKTSSYVNGVQPACNDSKFGGLELLSPVPSEQEECSKLKLILRSKPLERLEPPSDYKQVCRINMFII